jgi:drug/metabolite transporter (DMT)-like permease
MTKRKLLGISVGFSGVVFVFLENEGVNDPLHTGDIIILLATLTWACNSVYLKRIINAFSPFQIVFYSTLISVPFFLAEALLWDTPMIHHIDWGIMGGMAYQGLITASFGFVAWNHLLKHYGAVALHSFVFIMPIVGVFLGGLILDEPITKKIILALCLVTSGLLIVHLKPKKPLSVIPIRRNM